MAQNSSDQTKLLIARTKSWVESLPPADRTKPSIMTMAGKVFTPEQVVAEMEKDTPMGKVFKAAEELMLKRTLDKKKKAGLVYGTQ